MKTLLLIDSHSLIHRAYHALPPLTSPDGKPAQALYGLGSILLKITGEDKPDYIAALFDRPEPTFREKKYEAYKAQRPKAADELVSQLIEARNLFSAFGIPVFELPGYEADDLIATFALHYSKEKDVCAVILTGDMDTMQLVTDKKIMVRVLKKGVSETMLYDEAAVKERYGLPPEKLIDYKALVGDSSDNIKGVVGVGPKTAADLIQRYGSLDKILKSKDKDKKVLHIQENKKDALLSRELVELLGGAPIKMPPLQKLHCESDPEMIKAYFEKFGFGSLLRRMGFQEAAVQKKKEKEPVKATYQNLFSNIAQPQSAHTIHDEVVVFRGGVLPKSSELSSKKTKLGFNLKPAVREVRKMGGILRPPFFDLGVGFWLTDSVRKEYDPEAFFQEFFKRLFKDSDEDILAAQKFLKKKLTDDGLMYVFSEIEMPVLDILADMEQWGITTNKAVLKKVEKKMTDAIAILEKSIYKKAGREFNINSSGQLGEILFDKLGLVLPRNIKTPGGARSTRAEVLEILKDTHPIVPMILEYRELFKLNSTYVSTLPDYIEKDGRMRTEYLQMGTATGRIGSASPNLQNIPRESSWSPEIRKAFEATKGYSLVAFDYSQIELRLLAAVSGDGALIQAFQRGDDIHRLTASKVLKIKPEQVKPEMRRMAKVLNFGLIYGMGARAFSKTSGFSQADSAAFIKTYYEEFPRVKEFQEKVKAEARKFGYVKTLTGRRRYFPEIVSGAPQFVAAAEREAMNHPLQGLDADINKLAMIKVAEWLKDKGYWGKEVKLLLTIHDELLFEIRDDKIEETAPKIRDLMEGAYQLSVPLTVQISVGKNWGSLVSRNKK
ncbi:MAG: DNA polymerase [Patescibacteria group bacterium]